MSLYTPRHFRGSEAQAMRLIRDNPFATLVTTVDGAEPQITHVPMRFEHGVIEGHMARANPHCQAFAHGRTLAIFQGPHAYISPRWYVEPADHVPTWNYAVVHVHGRPQMLGDAATSAAILQVTAHYEQGAWAPAPDKLARLAPGVVAFRMPIERMDVKVKMNQNRTPADRAQVVATLRASARAEDRAVVEWIEIDPPA
ncbi:MAG: FMN-binding negative transcriptional regulator [Sinimarinibacterium sp.]|jgi:transcriptional regulator